MRAIKVISLGWGVQSFTLLAMVAEGELPMIDVAIHADTHYERSLTYKLQKKYIPIFKNKGIRIELVDESYSAECSGYCFI